MTPSPAGGLGCGKEFAPQHLLSGESRQNAAISLLREHEPEGGYLLSFSGGKDSVVILHLAKLAGVKFDAHYHVTTLDPPELMRFIKDQYPDVIWDRPKMSFFQLIAKERMLPTRKIRFCCRILKEVEGRGRVVVTGIRSSESFSRSKRKMVEISRDRKLGKMFVHPILDWSEVDVWDYIRHYEIPYCQLYDMGWSRIGCLFCPMKGGARQRRDAFEYPRYYHALLRAIQRMLDNIHSKGKEWNHGKTPEEVWQWWTQDQTMGKRSRRTQNREKGVIEGW